MQKCTKYAKIYKNMQQHIKKCRKYAKIQNMQKKNLNFSLVYSFIVSLGH